MMNRLNGLDWLRGLAAFGIVGCHLGLSPCSDMGKVVLSFCDFNVGLFAAIAGFFMNDADGYVVKRIKRILPVYLIWSVIYVLATALFDLMVDGGCLNERYYSPSNWLKVLLIGSASAHLWFLICLLYAQISLHGISSIMIRFKVNHKSRFVLLSMMSMVCLYLSCRIESWYCCYPVRLVSFLLLGYVLKDVHMRRWWFWVVTSVFMAFLHIFLTCVPGFARDYMLAAPLLLFFAVLRVRTTHISSLLATTSMGIFLMHPLFARGISWGINKIVPGPYGPALVGGDWVLVWVISFCLVLLARRIPFIFKYMR